MTANAAATEVDVAGVPPGDLSSEDLQRELRHLYETREETLYNGSEDALDAHTDRMLALEKELLRREPELTAPDPSRVRAERREAAGQPVDYPER
jgi:hypothetical protein